MHKMEQRDVWQCCRSLCAIAGLLPHITPSPRPDKREKERETEGEKGRETGSAIQFEALHASFVRAPPAEIMRFYIPSAVVVDLHYVGRVEPPLVDYLLPLHSS